MLKGNRIKVLRKKKGMTMQTLAAAVGTSQQQIDRLEKSKRRLTVGWMERLGNALDCSMTELLPSIYQEREQVTCKVKVVGGLEGNKVIWSLEKDVYSLLLTRPKNSPSPRLFAILSEKKIGDFPAGTELVFCELDKGKKLKIADGKTVICENAGKKHTLETTPVKEKSKEIRAVLLKSIRTEWA